MGEEIVIGLGNYRELPIKPHSNLQGNRIHLGTTSSTASWCTREGLPFVKGPGLYLKEFKACYRCFMILLMESPDL